MTEARLVLQKLKQPQKVPSAHPEGPALPEQSCSLAGRSPGEARGFRDAAGMQRCSGSSGVKLHRKAKPCGLI